MRLFVTIIILIGLAGSSLAQKWPSSIRGYRVHDAKIRVSTPLSSAEADAGDAVVTLSDPRLADVGLTGITFEFDVEVSALTKSGHVDFVTFSDFRVNGTEIEVEEYRHSFGFRKSQSVKLPHPARAVIHLSKLPSAAYKHLRENRGELDVVGTVFVFGRFKRFGFSFKRVVPVTVSLKIKNPLVS